MIARLVDIIIYWRELYDKPKFLFIESLLDMEEPDLIQADSAFHLLTGPDPSQV